MQVTENKALDAHAVKESYCSAQAALRYVTYFKGSPRLQAKDRREKNCIRKGLAGVPRGSKVLDLPCGTGRMYPLLKELGLFVTSADCSAYMVDTARQQIQTNYKDILSENDRFCIADVLKTDFKDKEFDAVVCNRLFHHFSDAATRQKALAELNRICSGPIVVSFFSTISTDALKFYFKKYIRREVIKDRIPISPWTFARDVRAAGLTIKRWSMARPLISKQWYFIVEPEAR